MQVFAALRRCEFGLQPDAASELGPQPTNVIAKMWDWDRDHGLITEISVLLQE